MRQDQISEEFVLELLNKVNLKMLGDYKNQATPIKVKCNECEDEINAWMTSLLRGRKPRCSCSRPYETFNKKKIDKFLSQKNLRPIEEYPGATSKPWRMLCLNCNNEIAPALANLKKGQGCRYCNYASRSNYNKNEIDKFLSQKNLRPIEEYPGATSKPWRMLCLNCGNKITPTLENLKKGQGCRYCNVSTKKYDETIGRVYLIHHEKEKVLKIGITNQSGLRLKQYNKDWKLIKYVELPMGKLAYKLEKEVLKQWRLHLGLSIALSSDTKILNIVSGGYTETADESGKDDAIKIINNWIHNGSAKDLEVNR